MKKFQRQLDRLENQIRRLKPQQTHGILTANTVRGVVRRPDSSVVNMQKTTESTVCRWG